MWIVIHMAKSFDQAQLMQDLLGQEGFLVRLHPIYRKVSQEANYYEVKVPESEAQEARQVLFDNGLC